MTNTLHLFVLPETLQGHNRVCSWRLGVLNEEGAPAKLQSFCVWR